MSLKLFSSVHEGGRGRKITRFFEKEDKKNRLWVLALLPLSGIKADEVMKQLERTLESKLLSNEAEKNQDGFEAVMKDLNEGIPNIIGEKAEEVLRTGGILLAYLYDEELMVSIFGQGEVFLLRNRSLIEISEGLSPTDTNAEFFQNISSGDIQNGDKILFSTFRIQRYITERQLIGILEDGVTEAMESITSVIDAEEDGNMLLLNAKVIDALPFEDRERRRFASASPIKDIWNRISNVCAEFLEQSRKKIPCIQKNQILLGGAGVIALLLIILFFNLLSGKSGNHENMEYAEFISGVEQKFSTIETRILEKKVDQANLILDQIERQANEMLVKRIDVANAERILIIARNKREYINNIMRISNPEVMSDLTAVNPSIAALGFFFLKDEILVYDRNSVYRVLIAGENAENIGTVTNTDGLQKGIPFLSKEGALFIMENGNILEWKDGQVITADTADKTWKNAADISTFSKFLYFLDPSSQQIWKYESRDSGFTIPEGWVTKGQEFLKNAVSFSIDGSIFVLTDKGEIIKFHRGEKVAYEIKGVPGGSITGDQIYTDKDIGFLFVLDKEKKQIFIFSKFENEAVYEQQIILENISEIVDFFATENKIFVLTKERIFEIALASTN